MTAFANSIPSRGPHGKALNGKVVLKGDNRWDGARRAFNLAVDQRPAAVVLPESVEDVATAVRWAAERGLRLAPQATGHNASPLGPLQDAILLRTDRMRRVTIDAPAAIARVEAGAVWVDVVQAAARHGLAALAGSSPNVGVTGYLLGGGLSFLGRKYGLAANSVVAIELVTADGRFVRTDRDNEPDLFWALRGGGGSFGVVTAIELRLFPVTEVYAGLLWYPIEREGEVLRAWHDLTRAQPPDELTTWARYLNLPSAPDVPEPVRGKSFVVVEACHLGDVSQADTLLAPLRALGPVNDTVQTISMPALSHLNMDPEQPTAGTSDGLLLAALPPEALEVLTEVTGAAAGTRMAVIELRHLEGEFGRARPQNGVLASLPAPYCLVAGTPTPTPELVASAQQQLDAIEEALAPWTAAKMYLNFAEKRRDPASFWTEPAYERLRHIKATVDPDDLILSNQPVHPGR